MKEVLEVKATWGTQVLSVRHLEPGQAFAFAGVPIVLGREDGWLVSKPGGEPAVVTPAQRVSMEVGGVTIEIAAVPAVEEPTKRGLFASIAESAIPIIGLSFIGHVSILATMASFEPPPKRPITEGPPPEQLLAMKALLDKADEREAEEYPEDWGGIPVSRERMCEIARRRYLTPEPEYPRVPVPSSWPRIQEEEESLPRVPPPTLRQGTVTSDGKLPVEVIQRIIRQNFGRFRLCYENGLRQNPKLAGTVTVKLVIGRDGAVSTIQDGGSDLPDKAVVSCVVRAMSNISFPQPESGIVTVSYPVILRPHD